MDKKRPNILFLFSDQHNPKILGCAGDKMIRTPSLDRLAEQGVRFDNAYCQNPLCVPSRASMITGRYCKSLGIYDNQHVMEANGTTFPRVLGAAGYRTCLIGKAHFNGEQFQGYQQRPYGDFFGQAHQPDPVRSAAKGEAGLGRIAHDAGPSGIPMALTQTEICVAESVKWLQTHIALHPDQPFCLCTHFDKPHFPINPPERFYRNYAGKVKAPDARPDWRPRAVPFVRQAMNRSGVGLYDKAGEMHDRTLAAYYGCIEWVDDAVGRIVEALDYLGLSENTLIIYTTDHGEMAGERGMWQKTVFFDAAARVPLIVRWPGVAPGKRRIGEPVGLIDLFPTLCEAAAIPVPASCEGLSVLPLLTGRGAFPRDAIFCESVVLKVPEHAGCMVRTGDWKYAFYLDGQEELYNLKDDPDEFADLAQEARHKDTAAALRRRVTEFWRPEEQMKRYTATPRMPREKHFYWYSNQFMLGEGTVVDARP